MSVQSHLSELASQLNLKQDEKDKVNKSIDTLSKRLNMYFNSSDLKEHFIFGSYTRNTILPRKADNYSDVDYMVVFENPHSYKPQTLLNNLKSFVNQYYTNSQISQSHPTIVLELNHIKFELVPAKKDLWGYIYIPSKSSPFDEWIKTDPNAFNKKISDKNVSNNNEIKPLVRLIKYWNRLNGNSISSYLLENWIVEQYYFSCLNIKDYVYNAIEKMNYDVYDTQGYKNKVERAKKIVADTKKYERKSMPYTAESEIKKLFPDL